MRPPLPPLAIPEVIRRKRGRRSAKDVVAPHFRCTRYGCTNPIRKHTFFDVPVLECKCCKEKCPLDFDFNLCGITINLHKIFGDILDQGNSELCEAFAFAKIMEMTKKIQYLMLAKDPRLIRSLNPFHLFGEYKIMLGGVPATGGSNQTILMAMALKERGIMDYDRSTIYRASNVSTICRNDHQAIVSALASGFPLHATILQGTKLTFLRYCTSYEPPDFFQALKVRAPEDIPCHAIVLVGAVKKKGKLSYYFLNAWKRFCARRSEDGTLLACGIGKVNATRLYRNVIKVSRFKEAPNERSFTQNMALNTALLIGDLPKREPTFR